VRDVFCNRCNVIVRGHGTTRVLSKLVFDFCASCWRNREDCEAFMRHAAGIKPDPTLKEVAGVVRAQAALATADALPASLERFLVQMGEEVDAA
jgi:hypothetical protein